MTTSADGALPRRDSAQYLDVAFQSKGIGGWRDLYLRFLRTAPFDRLESLIELGSGSPDFLRAAPQPRKVAVDIGDRYAEDFRADGIAFFQRDLDKDALTDLGGFDVAICSDVFEHLYDPVFALSGIRTMLGGSGVLISHIPNEFALKKTVSVMMGRSTSLYFHKTETEWTDPHLRRFTRIGFERFLGTCFAHNIPIQHLKHARLARGLRSVGLGVPYCLEGGPTFVSTDDPHLAAEIRKAVKALDR
ncbi:hypothetical protein KL86APRO_20150 [uncultured Alphaproteobacteria bacterium]|uniref:Uncharacterized protein n=1 Tax=uncultured Alphaproteobacteria bacterium TaxID=91750 RepID=A0A212KI29_9PROT|nr:hypothetical protein KL86APRO_20150 [uncultured Alphaproteobacteria bacterium]